MIDIHNHILPGIDDGSKTLEESLEMINIAKSRGTKKMIVTPHLFNPRIGYVDVDDVKGAFSDLKQSNKTEVELFLGSEIFCTDLFLDQIDQKQFITINDTDYILVEFPFDSDTDDIVVWTKEIIRHGYHPIIAHPERYKNVRRNGVIAEKLVNKGALLQINATSLFNIHGHSANEYAMWLLENELVSFVASDAHDMIYRNTDLEEAFVLLYRCFSKKYAEDLLFNNPQLLLSGNKISVG